MRIALLGSAPSSLQLAPYDAPEWKIWGCSPGLYGYAKRVDAWFELHRWEPGQSWFSPEYCTWLSQSTVPVFMNKKIKDVPNSVELPWRMLVNKYGPYFFTSSLAWMTAMAIEAILEAKEPENSIGYWGVDMAANEEWADQRPGCWYFATLAKSLGIEVGIPPQSDLFSPPPLYGISELDHGRTKMYTRREELTARLSRAEQTAANATAEIHFVRGALDDMQWTERTWMGHPDNFTLKYLEPPIVPALTQIGQSKGNGETTYEITAKWETPIERKPRRSPKKARSTAQEPNRVTGSENN